MLPYDRFHIFDEWKAYRTDFPAQILHFRSTFPCSVSKHTSGWSRSHKPKKKENLYDWIVGGQKSEHRTFFNHLPGTWFAFRNQSIHEINVNSFFPEYTLKWEAFISIYSYSSLKLWSCTSVVRGRHDKWVCMSMSFLAGKSCFAKGHRFSCFFFPSFFLSCYMWVCWETLFIPDYSNWSKPSFSLQTSASVEAAFSLSDSFLQRIMSMATTFTWFSMK